MGAVRPLPKHFPIAGFSRCARRVRGGRRLAAPARRGGDGGFGRVRGRSKGVRGIGCGCGCGRPSRLPRAGRGERPSIRGRARIPSGRRLGPHPRPARRALGRRRGAARYRLRRRDGSFPLWADRRPTRRPGGRGRPASPGLGRHATPNRFGGGPLRRPACRSRSRSSRADGGARFSRSGRRGRNRQKNGQGEKARRALGAQEKEQSRSGRRP